jgi:hypothetical protein
MHQREQLAAGVGRPRPVAEVDELVGGLLDPQPLRQRGGQQQASMRDGPRIIQGDLDLVQYDVEGWHRKGVLRLGDHDRLAAVILPGQGNPFRNQPITRRITDSVDRGSASDVAWGVAGPQGSRGARPVRALASPD